jgi:hypothetical protein
MSSKREAKSEEKNEKTRDKNQVHEVYHRPSATTNKSHHGAHPIEIAHSTHSPVYRTSGKAEPFNQYLGWLYPPGLPYPLC